MTGLPDAVEPGIQGSGATTLPGRLRRAGHRLALLFALLAAGIAASGWIAWRQHRDDSLASIEQHMASLAEFQSGRVSGWLNDMRLDLELVSADPLLARQVERWLAHGGPQDADGLGIADRLRQLERGRHYLALFLLDPAGEVRLATRPDAAPPTPGSREHARRAVRERDGVLSDFHETAGGGREIELDYVFPLGRAALGASGAAVTVYVRVDPRHAILPLLAAPPAPGPEAGIAIIEKSGGDFRYRLDSGRPGVSPVPFGTAVSDPEALAALVSRGARRLFLGRDPSGQPVLGVVRALPERPWFVLASTAEAAWSGPVEARARAIATAVAALILAAGILLGFVWRQLRSEYLLREYETRLQREALSRHYEHLARHANDIILLSDPSGRIIEANERAAEAYGYTRAELAGRLLAGLHPPGSPPLEADSPLLAAGARYEGLQRRRDGSSFPVEISTREIVVGGSRFRQDIVRDITERRQAEQALQQSRTLLGSVLEHLPDAIALKDAATLRYVMINRAGEQLLGRPASGIIGHSDGELHGHEQAARLEARDREALDAAHTVELPEDALVTPRRGTRLLHTRRIALREAGGAPSHLLTVSADITERKRWESMLRERENRLAALFERGGEIILVHDRSGRILEVNAKACESLGYDRAELAGMRVPDIDLMCVPNRPEGPWTTLRPGEAMTVNGLHRRRDDSTFPVEVRVSLVDTESGPLFVAVARDVTGRRRAEEAAREVRDRLRAVIWASPLPIAALAPDGQVTMWNPAAERVFGWPEDEAIGRMNPIVPPDREGEFRDLHARACGGESFTGIELKRLRRDGSVIDVSLSVAPFHDEGGRVSGVMAVLEDITGRLRIQRALAESEEKFRSYIDHALDGVLVADAEGRFLEANPAACQLYGYAREELLGLAIPQLIDPEPGNFEQGLRHFQRVRDTGRSTGEVVNVRKDGTRLILDINAVALDGGRFLGFVRDVTPQRRAEQDIRLYAKVFERSEDAIIICDGDNDIVAVNRAFTKITGYAEEEVVGKNPRLLSSGRQGPGFYAGMWRSLRDTGHWQGELWNRRRNGEIYPEWTAISAVRGIRGEVSHYIAIFSDITERKAAEEQLSYLAQHDALTGLPNRTLMQDRLSQALVNAGRNRGQLAVMFLDLDHFKNINDSLGHQAGDVLLKEVARRLVACVRESDTVSRIGGDEFVVVLPEIAHPEDAAIVAEKMIRAVSRPFPLDGHEIGTTPSIGISIHPEDGADIGSLVKNADTAMYHAKENGRNNYQFFTQDMNARAFERLMMENSLRRALERGEFELHYQPQQDVRTGKLIGMEALLRWRHPDAGLVPPARFIRVAEESGLIIGIGEWAVAEACRQNRIWQDAGLPAVPVAVNLSAHQFHHRGFTDMVSHALRDAGLQHRCLELEITESAMMQDVEGAIRLLGELRRQGVQVSLDDFGTGYSSLSYLKRIPLDKLKIDQSFVRDIARNSSDRSIVKAVIGLGHSLGLSVLAEGVETDDQFAFLARNRCDAIQGFHVARPLPAAEMAERLAAPARRWVKGEG